MTLEQQTQVCGASAAGGNASFGARYHGTHPDIHTVSTKLKSKMLIGPWINRSLTMPHAQRLSKIAPLSEKLDTVPPIPRVRSLEVTWEVDVV